MRTWSAAIVILLLTQLCAHAANPSDTADRIQRLKTLAGAVKGYRILHDGKSPAKLSELYHEGLAESVGDFVRPGSATKIALETEIDGKSDYTLEPLANLPPVIVREKAPTESADDLLAAFVDGSIKVVSTQGGTIDLVTPTPQPTPTTTATPKATSTATPLPSVTPVVSVAPQSNPTPGSTDVRQMATTVLTFDKFPDGQLPANAFQESGLRITPSNGIPEVVTLQNGMLLPPPCRKVLLVGSDRVTSFDVEISPPVKRFAIYRAGAMSGASIPGWTITAYDSTGRAVSKAGEGRAQPNRAMYFGVRGGNIARVVIASDNSLLPSATWNSVPIAAFGFDR